MRFWANTPANSSSSSRSTSLQRRANSCTLIDAVVSLLLFSTIQDHRDDRFSFSFLSIYIDLFYLAAASTDRERTARARLSHGRDVNYSAQLCKHSSRYRNCSVDAVQGGLGGDGVLVPVVAEPVLADVDDKVLGDLAPVQDLAGPQRDLVLAAQRAAAPRARRGDFLQVGFGGVEQRFALAGPLGFQER